MVATYRAAARFIEKTRDANPTMIYTNVSFVGSTALAEELKLLGPRSMRPGQLSPRSCRRSNGYSSVILDYKSALSTYSPGEAPDLRVTRGLRDGTRADRGAQRTGPQLVLYRSGWWKGWEPARFDMGLGMTVR